MGLFNWFKGKKKGQEEEKVEESLTKMQNEAEESFSESDRKSENLDENIEETASQTYEEEKTVEISAEGTTEQTEISVEENQLQNEVSPEKTQAEIKKENVILETQMEKQREDNIGDGIKGEDNMEDEIKDEEDLTDDAEAQSISESIKEEVTSALEHQEAEETQEEPKEKKMGFFKRLVSCLTKTRNNIVSGIDSILKGFSSIDDDFYEELEEILIMGDLGVNTTMAIIEDLKEKVKEQKIKEPAACKELLIESIKKQMAVGETAYEFEDRKSVILLIGVNGVGKTTTIGKLSGQFKQQGKKVMVAAADTFRAAAIDQLAEWAKRAKVDIIAQQEGSDPAAVVYDAVAAAKARGTDILLCDTAGRLHNKKNLMEELRKINKVIDREYPDAYKETLVVLDGTTGQNALAQAKQFNEVAEITGIVLTKLDGTAKGGIAIAIQSELGIPVKYIGIGEKIEDLQKFDSEEFVNALFDMSE